MYLHVYIPIPACRWKHPHSPHIHSHGLPARPCLVSVAFVWCLCSRSEVVSRRVDEMLGTAPYTSVGRQLQLSSRSRGVHAVTNTPTSDLYPFVMTEAAYPERMGVLSGHAPLVKVNGSPEHN